VPRFYPSIALGWQQSGTGDGLHVETRHGRFSYAWAMSIFRNKYRCGWRRSSARRPSTSPRPGSKAKSTNSSPVISTGAPPGCRLLRKSQARSGEIPRMLAAPFHVREFSRRTPLMSGAAFPRLRKVLEERATRPAVFVPEKNDGLPLNLRLTKSAAKCRAPKPRRGAATHAI